jgi:AraC-like DNA-binding protein
MVRASAIVPCVEFLENVGAPVDRLFEDMGLSPRLVSDRETLLPTHKALTFLGAAARFEGLDTLGLVVGLRAPFETLGRFARVIRGVPTLQRALSRLIDAIVLYNSGDRLWLTLRGDRALFCHSYAMGDSPGRSDGEQFVLAMMIAAIRAVLGVAHWRPDEIRLPAWQAGSRQAIEAMLQTPVICAGTVTTMVFPATLLAAPACDSVRGAVSLANDDRLLRITAPAEDFAGSVRQTVGALLRGGNPSIRDASEAVGLSVRTLQRRLAESGETYSGLLDAVRLETGAQLLRDSDAKLIEIALELGYADPANFTRAFKRWTGVAPRAFRQRQDEWPPPGALIGSSYSGTI